MSQSNRQFNQHREELDKKGKIITPIREAILKTLCRAKQPLTARQILNSLSKQKVSAHRATVYRDIEFLTKNNLVNSYSFKDESVLRYEIVSDHHHHAVCESCGHVKNIVPEIVETAIDKYNDILLTQEGFHVTNHRLKFYGKCKQCNKKHNQYEKNL